MLRDGKIEALRDHVVKVFDQHALMLDVLERIEILTRASWRDTQIHEMARDALKEVKPR